MALPTSISVRLYTKNDSCMHNCSTNATCESVCNELCVKLNISPAASYLFALRFCDTNNFLPGSQQIQIEQKYDFRLRFQMAQLSTLKRMDKEAYNYFYHQIKYDLIEGKIPELAYPNYKDQVAGLCVTIMYIEMLENHTSIADLEANYKKYVPVKHVKKHSFVIKQRISNALGNIRNRTHDSFYVKGTFLESIKTLAPNYLVERCSALAPYLAEEELTDGRCAVDLEFSPYHAQRPGFSIYYAYKKLWKHISRTEDIYAIIIEGDEVIFEMYTSPVGSGFNVRIPDVQQLKSFVSCIAGYYRLMVRWTVDLCADFASPALERLRTLKCYGPIGGECAYFKLMEHQSPPGSYIIRQCEQTFDVYYIDIICKGILPETYKIVHAHNMWHLYMPTNVVNFGTLQDLAKSIKTESTQKFRLAPSPNDKFPTLLLCLPPSQLVAKRALSKDSEFEMRQRKTQILNHGELRKYIKTKKETENGLIVEMKADWMLPEDRKLEVSLKMLTNKDRMEEFMLLAEKWSGLTSPELVKLYGITLSAPATFVTESTQLGPLNEFLAAQKQTINMGCLIDAAHSLAKALHYLQEKNFVHGRIRCAALKVIRFEAPNLLFVRLADPGLRLPFSRNDVPWIPHDSTNEEAKSDLRSDVWAFATTLWEIFSRGRMPTLKDFLNSRRQLPKPVECPVDIYKIMLDGWNPKFNQRLPPQIFNRLVSAKDQSNHLYTTVNSTENARRSTTASLNGSITSGGTERTTLSEEGSYTSNGGYSHFNDSESNCDDDDVDVEDADSNDMSVCQYNFIDSIGETYELPDGNHIVLNRKLGSGHYGVVYHGILETNDSPPIDVAIKKLKCDSVDKEILMDFEREIKIMKNLKHKNIVKIITHLDSPLSIIMEFVKHSSFIVYLNANAPSLSTKKLLKFSKDIASGMEYLVSQRIVHRDLAARNVLVDIEECVKISDFGLAQVIDSNGYYTYRHVRDIPIKWYAPETLRLSRYSFMSDVWSYGVTLFEMFSRGSQPDLVSSDGLSIVRMLDALDEGQRLNKPWQCPDRIYDSLMMPCWKENPKERPSFTEILGLLDVFIAEYGERID